MPLNADGAATRGEATGPWLAEHVSGLLAFFVSFVIVAATWTGHHRLFHDVAHLSRPLTWLNIGWALSIVFLQLPSAMIYQLPTDRWGPVLYAATLLVSQPVTRTNQTSGAYVSPPPADVRPSQASGASTAATATRRPVADGTATTTATVCGAWRISVTW